ncbi:MAG TPA: N-acetylmuramoyl-L-alanine amidase [Roseiflexaceae bacterium]|nr:N-acetylmuramoyl-L-alanine amidase [Roseiflexaceae bacterium]
MPDFPTTGAPPFIDRMLSVADWLNYVANYDFGPVAPTRVVLHHTWSPTVEQWAGLRSLQGIQRYYAGLGWTAGPHLFVGPDGIWLATPMRDIGIHAGVGNSGTINGRLWYSIGLEMVGDYDRVRPSGPVWDNVKAVLGGLSRRLNIAPRQLISFHRDYTNQKSCPGWAVTKDWVFGEVDAWLANQQPPPAPPPGPIGQPPPDIEHLADVLLNEAYSRRGEGFNSDWAFHQYAVQQNLGYPIGKSTQIGAGGKQYAFQPFARETLFNEVPNWGDVRRMSELLGGSIPPGGLGRALLEATYRAGGATFHPDWAFHQYALAGNLGPPIGESATITVDGVQYAFQVFATETIYNRVPNWSDIQRLSALGNTSDQALMHLRDTLLTQTYARAGVVYHPDWAFHQIARGLNLGAPLSNSYRLTTGPAAYAIQVYATDTLYNVIPNWSDVHRASELLAPHAATLGVRETTRRPLTALLSPNAQLEPAPAPFHILHYAAPRADLAAYSDRAGKPIELIVLHSDALPAEQALASMTAFKSRAMVHYYLPLDGSIYQLLDDEYAAWHAGMDEWNGQRQNINLISLGVMLQRGPDGYAQPQLNALAWLLNTLRQRYDLPPEAVVRWGSLDSRHGSDAADVPE